MLVASDKKYLKGLDKSHAQGATLSLIVWTHEWEKDGKKMFTKCVETITQYEMGQFLGGN